MGIVNRILFGAQAALLPLKWASVIDWPWAVVLIPLWFFVGILIWAALMSALETWGPK